MLIWPPMDTLLHRLNRWALEAPEGVAQAWKPGTAWNSLSVSALRARVEALARYLVSEGLKPDDIGVIYAFNSPSWVQMDLALMLAGGSSAGIYANASERQIQYILEHSEAKFLLVDSRKALEKVFHGKPVQELAPHLKKIIVVSPETDLPSDSIGFEEAVACGRKIDGNSFDQFLAKVRPETRATLIYTSGTTGNPKAVSLSHANVAFAAQSYRTRWTPPTTGRMFSFLPLAHIAERIANVGVGITNRYAVYFSSSPLNIASELNEVQPAILLCVPRLWDKLKEGAENRIARLPDRKRKILRWSMAVTSEYQTRSLQQLRIPLSIKVKRALADKVVKKLRNQLGVGNAARTLSGAAALSPATMEWFRGIGINLLEGYALTETSGVLTCGDGVTETANSVGGPYGDIDLRLADDGEIETRGPHVFQGYFKDESATAEVLRDGWLRTGDLGTFDARGNLKITGRKREIIKSAEGKMISPLYLESKLTASPKIDQAVVIGSERPYLVALFTLPEGCEATSTLLDQVHAHVDTLNRDVSSHEQIRAFRILKNPFSIENDEMTATMKLKRRVIEENFREVIGAMYDRGYTRAGFA